MSQVRIITITGMSGCGKSTLEKRLVAEHGFAAIRSFTTRSARAGELDGREYDFRDDAWYLEQLAQGNITQHVLFNGHLYGSTVQNIEEAAAAGKPIAIVVEPTGVPQFKEAAKQHGWCVGSLFMDAELELVIERLLQRFRDDPSISTGACTSRLISMVFDESNWWRGPVCFDANTEAFTPETEKEVISTVLRLESHMRKSSISFAAPPKLVT